MLMIAISFEHGISLSRDVEVNASQDFLLDFAAKEMGDDVDEIFAVDNNKIKMHYTSNDGWK